MDKRSPLTQVRGNPSKPVQTRRQLATNPEMSIVGRAHQFDRLRVWELVDNPLARTYQAKTGEHPSDTYVFTMKMEILLEPTSNKLLVELEDSYKDGDGDALFQLKSDSLPHAHAQSINTYYKH
ncbi:hypothetical protein Tco_0804429 [Tanacetum coccineum]|uniref:Uncharacterized protein n=1 Tax=Tanacetum coccineum TaxID=301880 RepID=A0ABQ5A797_9ASTR